MVVSDSSWRRSSGVSTHRLGSLLDSAFDDILKDLTAEPNDVCLAKSCGKKERKVGIGAR